MHGQGAGASRLQAVRAVVPGQRAKSTASLQRLGSIGVMLEVLIEECGDGATLLLRPGRHGVVAVQAVRTVGRGDVLVVDGQGFTQW